MSTMVLDYDDMDWMDVFDDVIRLYKRYFKEGDIVIIKQSSPNHFHAIFETKVRKGFNYLVSIARSSNSSQEYINRVCELGYFTIRTTGKSDGTPAPKVRVRID